MTRETPTKEDKVKATGFAVAFEALSEMATAEGINEIASKIWRQMIEDHDVNPRWLWCDEALVHLDLADRTIWGIRYRSADLRGWY